MATWPASISTATAGTAGNAADFNNHATALSTLGDAWASYTPTLKASTTDPTLGASSLVGRYRVVGKTADVGILLVVGSGFSAGSGTWRFGLPSGVVPFLAAASSALGTGTVRDLTPAATYPISVVRFSGTEMSMVRTEDHTGVSNTNPIATWAAGDVVSITISSLEIV